MAQWQYELGVTGPNVPERLVWVNFKFKFCTIISFTFSFRLPPALILWQQILIFTIRYWFWNMIIIFTRTFHDILLKKHWWASIKMKSLYHSIKIVFGYKFYYAVTIMIVHCCYYITLLLGWWNIDDHHRNPNTNNRDRLDG